jgi:hypothetical protein
LLANLSLELEGRVSLSTKREAEGKVCSQTDKSASRKSILWNIWLILGMRPPKYTLVRNYLINP